MTGREKERTDVEKFLEAGRDLLGLSVVAGSSGQGKRIAEGAMNRPGLALSGFYKHFAHRRIQVLGLSEQAYLQSLSDQVREERLIEFFGQHMPCVVIARNKRVLPVMKALANEHRVPLLRTGMITRDFISSATIVMQNLLARRENVQGTMVEIMGIGVLIVGKPGVGKSETALALIRKGHALVSDDITAVRVDSAGKLIASPVEITRYHMEIRGMGIIHVPSLFGVASVRAEKRLDVVVELSNQNDSEVDRSKSGVVMREVLGVDVPYVLVPVAAGRDLANMLETAALDLKLKRLGHDATKELDQQLLSTLRGGNDVSD